MGYTPFYIAQYEENSGLNTYFEPFLAPDKAFPYLDDAYCWRGRVRRRQGNLFLGRLRRVVAPVNLTLQAIGAAYNIADLFSDASIALRATEPNATLEIGSLVVTIGAIVWTDNSLGQLISAAPGNSGTINYATGQFSLVINPALGVLTNVNITFSYFPSLPVMGLRMRELVNINIEQTVAFDQKYAYYFDPTLPATPGNLFTGRWRELPSAPAVTWTGDSFRYFWTTNYWHSATGANLFWATNNNPGATGDPIRYYDGTTWTTFNPVVNAAGDTLNTCLCLLPFKDRMLAFNTTELIGAAYTNFPYRLRWSQNGSPIDLVNGWLDYVPGRGGFLDLTTEERITSVEYLRDVILVKCETSSWKLLYTGNEVLPFVFQKINEDYGSESTFNLVPFDAGVYAIGNYGLTVDDTTSVERMDIQIPDQIFRILNTGEVDPITQQTLYQITRVYGIRDFVNELVYWSFPDRDLYSASTNNFCDKLLVYNYRNQSYARFNDSYTCFGQFQYSANTNLTAGSIPNLVEIVAGNQQGFVEVMNKQVLNGTSLAITGITTGNPVVLTVPTHNFSPTADTWIMIDGVIGQAGGAGTNPNLLNYSVTPRIFNVFQQTANTFQLRTWNPITNAFVTVAIPVGGTYLGGGMITVVQNYDIRTKVFAPYYEQGQQVRLNYIDFLLDKTTGGETSCNVFMNEVPNPAINDPLQPTNTGLLGNNLLNTKQENAALIPMQNLQAKIWHRQFILSICQNFQIQLRMSNLQMSNAPVPYTDSINNNDFVMHAMTLYLSANARMTQ